MIRVPHFLAAVGCVGAMLTALPYWLAVLVLLLPPPSLTDKLGE